MLSSLKDQIDINCSVYRCFFITRLQAPKNRGKIKRSCDHLYTEGEVV